MYISIMLSRFFTSEKWHVSLFSDKRVATEWQVPKQLVCMSHDNVMLAISYKNKLKYFAMTLYLTQEFTLSADNKEQL